MVARTRSRSLPLRETAGALYRPGPGCPDGVDAVLRCDPDEAAGNLREWLMRAHLRASGNKPRNLRLTTTRAFWRFERVSSLNQTPSSAVRSSVNAVTCGHRLFRPESGRGRACRNVRRFTPSVSLGLVKALRLGHCSPTHRRRHHL